MDQYLTATRDLGWVRPTFYDLAYMGWYSFNEHLYLHELNQMLLSLPLALLKGDSHDKRKESMHTEK